jgi:hypothetical protein
MSVPLAVLIGPEGGFDEEERAPSTAAAAYIADCARPRILRADTAAAAALAIVRCRRRWRNVLKRAPDRNSRVISTHQMRCVVIATARHIQHGAAFFT